MTGLRFPRLRFGLIGESRSFETARRYRFGDQTCSPVEPGLDTARAFEEIADRVDNDASEVERTSVKVFSRNVAALFQLLLDLSLRPDEGDTIDCRHDLPPDEMRRRSLFVKESETDRLLDHLSRDLSSKQKRSGITCFCIAINPLDGHVGDSGVDVGRTVGAVKVDLAGALQIATERGIMLKPVAGAVLVDGKRAEELSRAR